MGKCNSLVWHVQLTLDHARKPSGYGGWRPGAGRPRTRDGVSHDRRDPVSPRHPQHVTLRIVDGLPSLRSDRLAPLIRGSISRSHREGFGIAEFNVEPNHLHLILEAASNEARARGLKGLNASIARQVNKAVGRRGELFDDRYHARSLRTPREVRNALRYVLNNARHHQLSNYYTPDWIDPCSSAPWFKGWREPVLPDTSWKRALLAEPSPVAEPATWLLRVGWRRHGEIAFDEVPGLKSRTKRSPAPIDLEPYESAEEALHVLALLEAEG